MEEIGDDDYFFYIPKQNKIPGSSEPQNPLVAQLGRSNFDGEIEFFDLQDESTVTIRLLSFLGPIFKALDAGTVVIVDEIDTSLHTLACEQIIALFQSPKTNPKGAQLIATTHDTNLLNPDTLRRDQVWFTEKDETGSTRLYPLTDYKPRKAENLERGYLQGRYGGIPFLGELLPEKPERADVEA
jgi:AAA15 family ATPase/GTPase